jgi:hypothetical protein
MGNSRSRQDYESINTIRERNNNVINNLENNLTNLQRTVQLIRSEPIGEARLYLSKFTINYIMNENYPRTNNFEIRDIFKRYFNINNFTGDVDGDDFREKVSSFSVICQMGNLTNNIVSKLMLNAAYRQITLFGEDNLRNKIIPPNLILETEVDIQGLPRSNNDGRNMTMPFSRLRGCLKNMSIIISKICESAYNYICLIENDAEKLQSITEEYQEYQSKFINTMLDFRVNSFETYIRDFERIHNNPDVEYAEQQPEQQESRQQEAQEDNTREVQVDNLLPETIRQRII